MFEQTSNWLEFEKSWQILASLMAYWIAFDIAWPKHDPTNGVGSWRGEHKTIHFKALVNVFRLEHFFNINDDFVKQTKWI